MDKELCELKQKRKVEKSNLTRFKNFLNDISANPQAADQIPARLQRVNDIFDRYQDIQSKIESLNDEETFVIEQETDRQQFEDSYFSAITKANKILERSNKQQPLSNDTGPPNAMGSNNSNSDLILRQPVKLPPLSLGTFDGSYEKWQHFYDTFKALIHDNQSLSNVQNFF